MYDPRGLREGYDFEAHMAGSLPTSMLLNTSSSSVDMTTNPLMAFCKLVSDWRTTLVNRLKRMSSCLSTVFMDSLYTTGYFLITYRTKNYFLITYQEKTFF